MIITETDKSLGKRLRQIREERGLSQEKLAREIGVVFQQIQKYEAGVNRISCSRLIKILEVFDISVIDFFAGLEIADRRLITEEEFLLFSAWRRHNPQTRQAILTLLGH